MQRRTCKRCGRLCYGRICMLCYSDDEVTRWRYGDRFREEFKKRRDNRLSQ